MGGEIESTKTWLSENKSIAAGKTLSVAIQITPPEEWHNYYLNSGGVEESLVIKWKLPAGFSAGPVQWPFPEVENGFSIDEKKIVKAFAYQGEKTFVVDISVPASLELGKNLTFSADATWQICKLGGCIPENSSFTFTLPVAASAEIDPATAEIFKKARAAQPTKISSLKLAAQSDGGDVQLRIEPASNTSGQPTEFIPNQKYLQPASAGGNIVRDGDTWLVTLKRITSDGFNNPVTQGNSISGILVGPTSLEIAETTIGVPPAKPLPFSEFLPILGGMLLGGLILNLMPCVFPVIGLKIMGFVQQAGEDRKKVILHGILFTLGVLLSFAVLSGILFAIRSVGGSSSAGWGYQLQDPWIVLTLMLLMFILGLNMFGIFEIGTSATSIGGSLQSKHGLSGSFFSGILATVVATPCSGPFLGTAIGVAVSLPPFQFFTAFAAMGLGLSIPYLLLSIFPKFIDFLPRPGPWMESFKQAMSFFFFATAGYLLKIYGRHIELKNLQGPIFGLTAIAIAAWIYGRWNLPHKAKKTRWVAVTFALAFAVGGFILAKPPTKSTLVWEHWSQERVDELTAAGTPVYIDFTADWCGTCQLNKIAYTPEVIALMKKKGIVALEGDKTIKDPKIEAKLIELNRTAIPVNVLYAPGKEPVVTPEILSASYLIGLFSPLPDKVE